MRPQIPSDDLTFGLEIGLELVGISWNGDVPTGPWAYGAYGHVEPNSVTALNNERAAGDTYYLKAGLRERWHPLGHTVLYGEYEKFSDARPDALVDLGITSGTTLWGLGVVQEIDAAAMSLWLSYRHLDASLGGVGCTNGAALEVGLDANCSTENFQYLKAGALINF